MGLHSKRGAVSLGLTVLIVIVVALVVLIVLSSALRTYLVGGFNFFAKLISGTSNSGNGSGIGGTTTTRFVAYDCLTTPCAAFPSADKNYTWGVDYDGQNMTGNVTAALVFTNVPGNYSYTTYPVNESGSGLVCSNLSYYSGYAQAGQAKIVYYYSTKCS